MLDLAIPCVCRPVPPAVVTPAHLTPTLFWVNVQSVEAWLRFIGEGIGGLGLGSQINEEFCLSFKLRHGGMDGGTGFRVGHGVGGR